MYIEKLQAEVENPNNKVTGSKFMHHDHGGVYCSSPIKIWFQENYA